MLESAQWGGFREIVRRLEREFAAFQHCAHGIGAVNGTVTLETALAHGSEWNGRRAGSFGMAGACSFRNSKVMTSGEGGMLMTNDAGFAERAQSFCNQGCGPGPGFFSHCSPTAVLLAQLERLLRSGWAEIDGLHFQDVPSQVKTDSHFLLLGRIDSAKFGKTRDEFHRAVTVAGIPCTPF